MNERSTPHRPYSELDLERALVLHRESVLADALDRANHFRARAGLEPIDAKAVLEEYRNGKRPAAAPRKPPQP